MRGVSTRVTWMSRAKCSWPTPTVKTGIERAFRLASDSSSEASEVSAPSVTITRPASGSPDSSSRARSSAWPSRVDVPPYFRSPAAASRSADEEKRKKRRTNRCDSALSSGPSGCRAAAARTSVRGWPSRSAIVMLRDRRPARRENSAAAPRPSGSATAGTGRTAARRATPGGGQRAPPDRAVGPRS